MGPNVRRQGNSRLIPNLSENKFAYLFSNISTELIPDICWLMSASNKSKAVTLEIIIPDK